MSKVGGLYLPGPKVGTLTALQARMVDAVRREQYKGMTSAEVSRALDIPIGTSSGQMSIIHANKELARLALNRGGRRIYVHPEYIGGRKTEPFGQRRPPTPIQCPHCGEHFIARKGS